MIQSINSRPILQEPLTSPEITLESPMLSKKKALIVEALKVENISAEALKYFQRVKTDLEEGINVPLPNYFHASRSWKDILRSTQIEMRPERSLTGILGKEGVFLSTLNEEGYYGDVAFAIDESCLKDSTAHFFYTKGNIFPVERKHALWVQVSQNIPINPETTAFIVASGDESDQVKALLKHHPEMVISRDLGDEITRIFESIIQHPSKTSPHWAPMGKYGEIALDESSKRFHHWWKEISISSESISLTADLKF